MTAKTSSRSFRMKTGRRSSKVEMQLNYLSNSGDPREYTPKLERALLSELRPMGRERLQMLEQAVCREQRLLVRALQSTQGSSPIPEPLTVVSRMVALICHDLRLPLTAILANAEFLTQSNISEMEREAFYQEISWSIDRMNELVSSLLECSRDRDTFRPAARNIVDTVESAIRMTGVRQKFRRITIKHHHKGLAVGWFDSHRIERVVANLVLNACEAVSPDSGQVVITTNGNRCCLQIGVWDNGPGIPPAIQSSVFQPFVSYGKAKGSGLGLAIAKKVVEDHGGEIYLDGRNGTGTLFQITIPFATPQRAIPLTSIGPVRSTRISRDMVRSVDSPSK
jgi:signal transduction histidine kinase